MSWLMKVKRYGGGESVVVSKATREQAQAAADDWNDTYQTDVAFIEECDRAKVDWPSWPFA